MSGRTTWGLAPIKEHQPSHFAELPRTPYPYDPVRENSPSVSDDSSNWDAASLALSSDEEVFALSPEIVEQAPEGEFEKEFPLLAPTSNVGYKKLPEANPRTVNPNDLRKFPDRLDEPMIAGQISPSTNRSAHILVNLSRPGDIPSFSVNGSDDAGPSVSRKRPQMLNFESNNPKRIRVDDLPPLQRPQTPPLTHQWNPSPISPERHFVEILAQKDSAEGTLYKVCWRASWVHESKLPDIENIRLAQMLRSGKSWDVLPES